MLVQLGGAQLHLFVCRLTNPRLNNRHNVVHSIDQCTVNNQCPRRRELIWSCSPLPPHTHNTHTHTACRACSYTSLVALLVYAVALCWGECPGGCPHKYHQKKLARLVHGRTIPGPSHRSCELQHAHVGCGDSQLLQALLPHTPAAVRAHPAAMQQHPHPHSPMRQQQQQQLQSWRSTTHTPAVWCQQQRHAR